MATVTLYPTSNTSGGVFDFNNPTNAYADDGTEASSAVPSNAVVGSYATQFYSSYDVDAVIPASAVINSVIISADVRINSNFNAGYFSFMLEPIVNGTAVSPRYQITANNVGTGGAVISTQAYTGLTRNDLLNGIFQTRIGVGKTTSIAQGITGYLDYINILIDYTDMLPAVPIGLTAEILTSGD